MNKHDQEKIDNLLIIRGEANVHDTDIEQPMADFPGKEEAIRNAVSTMEKILLEKTLDMTFKAMK